VICQLRFPPILKIDAEIPAAFQDSIREDFPDLKESSAWKMEESQGVKGTIPLDVFRQILQSLPEKNYEFSSENGQWKLNLTRTFIALTANSYERWERYREKLERPLKSLVEIYSPSSFSRVGLRYIDVIKRSKLQLCDVDWNELLQPYILGIRSSAEVGKYVQNIQSQYEVRLSDRESVVRIITKLVEAPEGGEECYMIDSDFYKIGKIDIDTAVNRLDYFNVRASRLIRWCITERLHQALGPQAI
jgi:uncharacterized protein (TIGR04255 family)